MQVNDKITGLTVSNLLTDTHDNFPRYTGTRSGWPWNLEMDPDLYSKDANWPKITVITPSYNQAQFLEETIRSVLLQNYPNLEYIIIDGGSNDHSLDIIKKYKDYITYWISEKDNGQANAINKGLCKTTGTVWNWINSDDYLAPGALKIVGEAFRDDIDIFAGSVRNFWPDSDVLADEISEKVIKNQNLSLKNYYKTNKFRFHQPGVWYRRSLFKSIMIDEKMQYCFDTKLLLDALVDNPFIKYSDAILVHFRMHNESKTMSKYPMFVEEFAFLHSEQAAGNNPKIAALAKYYLAQKTWRQQLAALRAQPISKTKKLFIFFIGVFKDPSARINRLSLGSLRRIFFN